MRRTSSVKTPAYAPVADSRPTPRSGDVAISARHRLLNDSWRADVATLKGAVVFFEVAGDADLHVNVTQPYATKVVTGWAGPGAVAEGYVYNRRFGDTPPSEIIRQVRDMVFATRSEAIVSREVPAAAV